jgi:hypothetical protein
VAPLSGGRYSWSIQGNPLDRIRILLGTLRLLEAAGACEMIAGGLVGDASLSRPRSWWEAVAASSRSYRSAIFSTTSNGIRAIEDWAALPAAGAELRELSDEKERLALEYHRWLSDVEGGPAYIAWLAAYVAVAELDGERALRSLADCDAILREFVDLTPFDPAASVYELLQSTADSLVLFLPLAAHPVRDRSRFAFLPDALRTGYGFADGLDIHSHRRARDPRAHPA